MSDWRRYGDVHPQGHTVSGTVLVWPALDSPQLGNSREILVYLPPSLASTWPAVPDVRTLHFVEDLAATYNEAAGRRACPTP